MNYLSAENLSKAYGDQVLFEGLTFGLSRGDKTALIARNGSGKTTLLRILGGMASTDTGEYIFRKGVKVAFLDQAPKFEEHLKVSELVHTASSDVLSVIQEYESVLARHSKEQSVETERLLEAATTAMDQMQGWDYENRLVQLLDLFRIKNREQLVGNMSGGELKRLALALILLDEPELIIMDEPTNHLDIDMIEWLEKYLSKANLTVLMVTHDRYFLDRVCNQILELDQNKLFRYEGNYNYFLEKRSERHDQRQVEADRATQLMKKELDWLRRMPKARTHKSKSRIDAFDGIKEKATMEKGPGELTLQVKIPRIGGKIVELDNVRKSYGDLKILDGFSYKFEKAEKIGVIGRNGSGKSSFLNLLTGLEELDAGKRIVGETIKMAYYRQMGMSWKENERVIDAVKEIAEVVSMKDGKVISASKFLEHFLFPPKDQYKLISKLSGGERRRLHLLTVLMKNPNFLILDEPTNDLDLFALNKLEEFLIGYEGNLVVVSHDRYFLDKLADHIFVFRGDGEVKDHYGRVDSCQLVADENPSASKEVKSAKVRSKPSEAKQKLSYKEKMEYEGLEDEIEGLENEKASIEEEIAGGGVGYEALAEKGAKVTELMELIEEKTMRWMELGERA